MSHDGEVQKLEAGIFTTVALGDLITALDQHARCNFEGSPADVRFDFCWLVPGGLHSYRGFYNHLAVSPKVNDERPRPSIVSFLLELKGARGQTFTGWKGGEYRMDENTPVWVDAPRDCSGTAIVGVSCNGYAVMLHTAHVEV